MSTMNITHSLARIFLTAPLFGILFLQIFFVWLVLLAGCIQFALKYINIYINWGWCSLWQYVSWNFKSHEGTWCFYCMQKTILMEVKTSSILVALAFGKFYIFHEMPYSQRCNAWYTSAISLFHVDLTVFFFSFFNISRVLNRLLDCNVEPF